MHAVREILITLSGVVNVTNDVSVSLRFVEELTRPYVYDLYM